jgi:hypothetical protein
LIPSRTVWECAVGGEPEGFSLEGHKHAGTLPEKEDRPMATPPGSDVQQVIDWWKEYGFKRCDWERSDVDPLFRELLNRMDLLNVFGQKQVYDWIDKNGY